MAERIPTSRVLDALLDEATPEHVSLGWRIDRLGERSFGIILLLLAFLALIPGVSPVAGLLTVSSLSDDTSARWADLSPRPCPPVFRDAPAYCGRPPGRAASALFRALHLSPVDDAL